MKSTDQDWLEEIAARATPLWDNTLRDARIETFDADLAEARLDRWRALLGSELVLCRRFLASPLPRPAATLLLGAQRRQSGELPPWACGLSRILAAKPAPDPFHDRSFAAGDPLPFQEALLPFVRHGRAQVARRAGGALAAFAPEARIALERQLLSHLVFVSHLAFGRDFGAFRFERAPASAFETLWGRQPRSTAIYEAYVRQLHQGGLRDFFAAYPVLARLLCQSVEQWEDATLDLLRRFRRDFGLLRETFGWRTKDLAWAVAQVTPDLSDRHHGGRTVVQLVLAGGERLIYKPRPMEAERAFYAFVDRLNRGGLPLELRTVEILARDGYGWAEVVPRLACEDTAAVARFYRRSGMLLAILHTLSTTDMHCENLIASGEHPVVVDLETILTEHQLPPPRSGEEPIPLGWDPRDVSVLRTGFLPQPHSAGAATADLSALGAGSRAELGVRHLAWQAINTDQMALSEDPGTSAAENHRVRLGGLLPPVAAYVDEVAEGFAAAYQCLLENRETLLADRVLLELFDGLELRVLLRGTLTYTAIHLHLLHPEYLADGIDRSLELEWLARPLGGPLSPQPGRAAIYEEERRAMERLDVPRFSSAVFATGAKNAADALRGDDDLAALYGDRDARVVERNLRRLSVADRDRQLALIEASIAPRIAAA